MKTKKIHLLKPNQKGDANYQAKAAKAMEN